MSATVDPAPARRVPPGRARPPAKPRRRALWRDPTGRISPLKIAALVIAVLPGLYVALAWHVGALGARYVTEGEREMGQWTIRLVILALAVTPARWVFDWPRVVLLRRMIGVTAAAYAALHVMLYALDQDWNFGVVFSEIALRFYLAIGFIVFLGLASLAITSTDAAMRRMGASWKGLHRLLYFLAVLALWHYALQSKEDVSNAVVAAGWFAWLMLWRLLPRSTRGQLRVLPLLAIAAALVAAGAEAAWYAGASHFDPVRVLEGNLDVDYGLHPAVQVAIWGLAVFLIAALRRAIGLLRRRRALVTP